MRFVISVALAASSAFAAPAPHPTHLSPRAAQLEKQINDRLDRTLHTTLRKLHDQQALRETGKAPLWSVR